jgi:Asp-tRNA(Asn)/Glu-tRNA(Gln) amidotransferase A subunit family amidase
MTCVEAITASLARIEETNKDTNACVEVLSDSALASALESDKRIAENDARPLEGLPILVKCNIEV